MKALLCGLLFICLVSQAALANPLITVASSFSVNEGQMLSIPISITAPDNETTNLTKSVSFGNISPNDGINVGTSATFTWTPTFTNAGTHSVTFTAKDANSSDTATVTVTVNEASGGFSVPATVALGGSSQRRSNPQHDRESDREVNVTGTLSITNSGAEPISNLSFAVTPKGGYSASDLLTDVKFDKTTLAPGESATATITARVPPSLDAVNSAFEEAAIAVATVTFSARNPAGNRLSAVSELQIRARNMLDISDATITVNGEEDDLDDNDRIRDLKAEDSIEMTLEIENLFDDREDVQIEDIEVRFEVDELDIDEEEELGDLGPDDTDTITLSFDLENDADEGSFDGLLTVAGTDENGATHAVRWEIEFEVERETHEVAIRKLAVTPETATCEDTVEVSVSIKNVGQRDEDEAAVRVEAPTLDYGDVRNFIEIDEDDSETETFTISLPGNLATGTHRIEISTYYDTSKLSDRETVQLRKEACGRQPTPARPPVDTNQTPREERPPIVIVTQPPQVNQTPTGGVVTVPEQETGASPFTSTTAYLVALGLAYVVVILIGLYMVARIVRK